MKNTKLNVEELEQVNGGLPSQLKFDSQFELDCMVYALWGFEKVKKFISNN